MNGETLYKKLGVTFETLLRKGKEVDWVLLVPLYRLVMVFAREGRLPG